MFVAVNRPPGSPNIPTRPSPDLFGLIDATSNEGSAVVDADAWARRRGAFSAPTPTGTAMTTAPAVARRPFPSRSARASRRRS